MLKDIPIKMVQLRTVEIDNQKINLSYSKFFGWKVVHPIRDENGKINLYNLIFGSKENLVFLIIVALFFGILFYGVNEMTASCRDLAEHPCDYCSYCPKTLDTAKLMDLGIPENSKSIMFHNITIVNNS